eukprot:scaffold1499_cov170-Amphora_coffeaeformis.AAC.9
MASLYVIALFLGLLATLSTTKTNAFHLARTQMSVRPASLVNSDVSWQQRQQKPIYTSTRLHMESDFGSAMPEKPTLTLVEDVRQKSQNFILDIRGKLDEGVAEPPELAALEEACKSDSVQEISKCLYALLIEMGMTYDKDPSGILTPTTFTDIPGNLEEPAVKSEFDYLYKYGMSLIKEKLLGVEDVKTIVQERLIQRTGLSPEEFDKWLGY